jgi:hypothetical protein
MFWEVAAKTPASLLVRTMTVSASSSTVKVRLRWPYSLRLTRRAAVPRCSSTICWTSAISRLREVALGFDAASTHHLRR